MWDKIFTTCAESKHKLLLNPVLDTVWMEGSSDDAVYEGSTYRAATKPMLDTFVQVIADEVWDSPQDFAVFIKRPQAWLVRRIGFPNGFRPMSNTYFAATYKALVEELNSRIDGNLVLTVE